MSETVHRVDENWPHFKPQLSIPETYALAIGQFLLDRKTGNVVLNIKDGRIMGLRVEELVRLK